MHDTADFSDRQRARGLLDHFQGQGNGHWPIAPYMRFERFTLDQFHGVETLTVLLSVINHASNIGMMNLCSRPRFAQKARAGARILRNAMVNDLEGDRRAQHCIASAISYGHRSRAELNRKTVGTYFHIEVGVAQSSRR